MSMPHIIPYLTVNSSMILLFDTNADVIGVCEEYENVQEIDTVNGCRNIVRFRMTDGRSLLFNILYKRLTSYLVSMSSSVVLR